MPSRYYKRVFVPNYCYHIYNRGANKRKIFLDNQDYNTFTSILSYYLQRPTGTSLSVLERSNKDKKGKGKSEKTKKQKKETANIFYKVPNLVKNLVKSSVSLTAYVLMPNHYHLLVRQISPPESNNGITNLMRRLTISYAMYFQKKYDHSGVLLQGKFKNVLVENDKQLLTLTKYIHTNPLEILTSNSLKDYKHSSYPSYLDHLKVPSWIDSQLVLTFFSKNNPRLTYQSFVESSGEIYKNIEGITID